MQYRPRVIHRIQVGTLHYRLYLWRYIIHGFRKSLGREMLHSMSLIHNKAAQVIVDINYQNALLLFVGTGFATQVHGQIDQRQQASAYIGQTDGPRLYARQTCMYWYLQHFHYLTERRNEPVPEHGEPDPAPSRRGIHLCGQGFSVLFTECGKIDQRLICSFL